MIEELFPNLYRIEIPLPENPLGWVNSYLVKGRQECLLIDTGMNREECWKEMARALAVLNVELTKTEFFITHFHIDHIGLLDKLASNTSRVYLNEVESRLVDYDTLRGQRRRQQFRRMFLTNGFPPLAFFGV